MSALVRVKRQLDEEPSDAIILCKRRKFNENSGVESQLSSAILKFAGTVQKVPFSRIILPMTHT